MPFDSLPPHHWDRGEDLCKRCQLPIAAHEATEEIRFDPDPEHRLDEMNGLYHAECAKPYVTVKRALDMLTRPHFFG